MKSETEIKTKTNNVLLGALIVQNSVAVLVARYVSTNFDYDVRKMLLIAELAKFVLACAIEAITVSRKKNTNNNSANTLLKSLYCHVWCKPLDALKLSIPALLFLLMSILAYIAISLVPVPLFLIVQQTKLVKTTFLSVVLLGRSYSTVQWCSILALCIGSGICFVSVVLREQEKLIIAGGGEDGGDIGGGGVGGAHGMAAAAHSTVMDMDSTSEQIDDAGANRIRRWLLAPGGEGNDFDYYFDAGGDDDGYYYDDVNVGSGNVQFHILGLILIVASNFCSSLAGVYFELVIKGIDKHQQNKSASNDDTKKIKGNEKDIENAKANTDEEKEKLVIISSSSTSSMSDVDDGEQHIDNTHLKDSNESSGTFTIGEDEEENMASLIESCDEKTSIKGDNETNTTTIVDDEPSIWMRNIQLGFFTLCIIGIDFACTSPPKNETPIFGFFNPFLWIQIFLFAFGGLLIALVIRHADNVQKGLCMGISVVLTSALSIGFDDSSNGIPLQFVFGALLAIGGCFVFSNSDMIQLEDRRYVFGLVVGFVLIALFLFRDELPYQLKIVKLDD